MSPALASSIGRIVWPAVRCSRGEAGIAALRPLFDAYPPGGVIVFGEGAPDVEELIARVRLAIPGDVLISSDLERGCGQQVAGRTNLPPAMAIAAAEAAGGDAAYEAGLLTGIEAREAGIDVVYAPVADVNTIATNPIIATRAFGDDPHRVATLACAFARGVADGGALAVGKHFPGHGSTQQDSHNELARVTREAESLHAIDLMPFRALIAEGVGGLMVGHLEVPALDPIPGRPATASPAIVRELLRERLGYDGLLVTDALDMGGFGDSPDAATEALVAGMDVLLMPADPLASARALHAAVDAGRVDAALVEAAAARVQTACELVQAAAPPQRRPAADLGPRLLADSITSRGGEPLRLHRGEAIDLQIFGEDEGGFVLAAVSEALIAAGIERSPEGRPVALVLTSVRAWAGSSRLDDTARERLHWNIDNGRLEQVLVMGSPYEALDLPAGAAALVAYEATPAAAFALVAVLAGRAAAPGTLPVGRAS